MVKKELSTSGLDAVMGEFAGMSKSSSRESESQLQGDDQRRRGRPVGSGAGGPERKLVSSNLMVEQYAKISAIAYWERRSKQDILDEALGEYISRYEERNGAVAVPER